MFSTIANFLKTLSAYTPPGLLLSLSASRLVDNAFLVSYRHEFIGSLLMIGLTFSAGKWWGADSLAIAWTAHAIGVVAADKLGEGPHVNPAVSVAMFSLGKVSYTEMYVRIAGQMGGGLVAFPLFRYLSDTLHWNSLGGPEFHPSIHDEGDNAWAMFSEFSAMAILCVLIYALNFELHFGKYHYWIKQLLTAAGIRFLIEVFPTAGPAINPMLGTAWAVFASGFEEESTVKSLLKNGTTSSEQWKSIGSYPTEIEHYIVYWVAPILGALLASFGYAVFSGNTFFGYKLPIGPLRKRNVNASSVEMTSSLEGVATESKKKT